MARKKKRIHEEVERIIDEIDQEVARMDRNEAHRYWLYSDLWVSDKIMPELNTDPCSEPDIVESGDMVTITLDLHGFGSDNVNLDLIGSSLWVYLPDRQYLKEIDLPVKVLAETIQATYRNGILDVVVRKRID